MRPKERIPREGRIVRGVIPAVLLSAVLAFTEASTATVYKCGNTYSNVPCDNAKKLSVDDAQPLGSTKSVNNETQMCIAYVKATLFDPDSAKIENAFQASGELISVAGQKIYAKKYLITVNAKNRYGGYVGSKVLHCHVSEATGRVLVPD
jgi:hypothetical protein